jgi:ketosteroid isomerase-like protein
MSKRATQLAAFMAEYERAANSHDVQRILPLIADDATHWFTDGSYRGREEITDALERTFAAIHDEVYGIREVEWVAATDEFAACRYRFSWRGVVDGQPVSVCRRGGPGPSGQRCRRAAAAVPSPPLRSVRRAGLA